MNASSKHGAWRRVGVGHSTIRQALHKFPRALFEAQLKGVAPGAFDETLLNREKSSASGLEDEAAPRLADGLRFAALARDEILTAARFHLSEECLRQDIFNWLVAAYDKGLADGRALATLEKPQ